MQIDSNTPNLHFGIESGVIRHPSSPKANKANNRYNIVYCLGIESTAHTFGCGIVSDDSEIRHSGNRNRESRVANRESGRTKCPAPPDNGAPNNWKRCAHLESRFSNLEVLSNESKMYKPIEGGIHPREAANHHANFAGEIVSAALEKAGLKPRDLDLVAFSQGPGLGPCLRTGATSARALAFSLGIPIIGVNHCIAHLEIGRATTGCKDPVMLYTSGANTQVIAFAEGKYRVFGETLDVGIGNALDKFGRDLGIPFPAGPAIEAMALKSKNYLPLPYCVKGMDVTFSGLMTAAFNLAEKNGIVLGTKPRQHENSFLNALCYSLQETAFAALVEVTERAMAHTEKSEVLLTGGVARNRRLCEMAKLMAEARGAQMFVPPAPLCIDNGAMIAWTGIVMHKSGIRMKIKDTQIDQKFRTDDVNVRWRE